MKYFILISIIFCSCSESKEKKFQLQVGDFLFQDLDSSPLCEAIESVTPGYKDQKFSHCAKDLLISWLWFSFSHTGAL